MWRPRSFGACLATTHQDTFRRHPAWRFRCHDQDGGKESYLLVQHTAVSEQADAEGHEKSVGEVGCLWQ